jgi:putative two-component system response regulator
MISQVMVRLSERIVMINNQGSKTKPVVLVVDDNPDNMTVVSDILSPDYLVLVANSGARALEIVTQDPIPDLILLDIMMPEMDGYAVMDVLKSNSQTHDIPVIFLTAMDSTHDEEKGLELGAVDYITKPIRPMIVLARVHTHLELKRARDVLRNQNSYLEAEISRRMKENELIQDVTIRALARLAEIRDQETGYHILRTSLYVKLLAEILQKKSKFNAQLSDETIKILTKSAPLHDIGKVGIPDEILRKPGKLTPHEWGIMQTHAELGARAIELAEKDSETTLEFLGLAKEIAHWHHERWDGTGYPDGLKGDEIPLSAKLMAIADVFDALVSKRIYKAAFTFEQARILIADGRSSHFDPDLVDAFIENYEKFVGIAIAHRDRMN